MHRRAENASEAGAGRRILLETRNADGGWGYRAGKRSRLEPTCWCALAASGDLRESAASTLLQWPVRDGLLVEPSSPLPNFAFNGLALTVLTTLGLGREARVQRLATTLENLAGERLSPSDVNTQDNSLRGWSWVPGTFSWVEPTAYVLLGLKVHASCTKRPLDRARIQEAEAVLFDRACRRGGWNYGNSNMLGAELRPYVPTTALALLALFDRRSHGAVAAGLRFLQEEALSERSGHALSLARIALLRYDAPTATLREALSRRGMSLDGLESIATVAMTSCALAEDAHAPFTF